MHCAPLYSCRLEVYMTIISHQNAVLDILDSINSEAIPMVLKLDRVNQLSNIVEGMVDDSLFILTAGLNLSTEGSKDIYTHSTSPNSPQITISEIASSNIIQTSVVQISDILADLVRYFCWFGRIHAVYVLGPSTAIFKMDPYSVEHVLLSKSHSVSIITKSNFRDQQESLDGGATTRHIQCTVEEFAVPTDA